MYVCRHRVRMYICMHALMHCNAMRVVCVMHAYVHALMHVNVQACQHVCMHVRMYADLAPIFPSLHDRIAHIHAYVRARAACMHFCSHLRAMRVMLALGRLSVCG